MIHGLYNVKKILHILSKIGVFKIMLFNIDYFVNLQQLLGDTTEGSITWNVPKQRSVFLVCIFAVIKSLCDSLLMGWARNSSEDPWIHFSDGYFEVYLLIKRIIFR